MDAPIRGACAGVAPPSGGTSFARRGCPGREEHRDEIAALPATPPAYRYARIHSGSEVGYNLGRHGDFSWLATGINRRDLRPAWGGVSPAVSRKLRNRAPAKAGRLLRPGLHRRRSILNTRKNMEYRSWGRTGLMVLRDLAGGHWKRDPKIESERTRLRRGRFPTATSLIPRFPGSCSRGTGSFALDDVGINYLDAMAEPEVLVYGPHAQGRRDKIYFGYAWWQKEPRIPQYRNAKAAAGAGRKPEGVATGLRRSWRSRCPWKAGRT